MAYAHISILSHISMAISVKITSTHNFQKNYSTLKLMKSKFDKNWF